LLYNDSFVDVLCVLQCVESDSRSVPGDSQNTNLKLRSQ